MMLTQLDLFGKEPKKQENHSEPKKVLISNVVPPTNMVKESPAVTPEAINAVSKPVDINVDQRKPSGRLPISSFSSDLAMVNIPEDEVLFAKAYYPISEVALMFNVNISLLRFWEKEFDVLKPRKNRKGDRLFRPEDIKMLKLIYFLLREKKYTIQGAKVHQDRQKDYNY